MPSYDILFVAVTTAIAPGAPKRMLVPIAIAIVAYGHVTQKFLHWSCPIRAIFHIPCPTCGMTSATRELLHFHVRAAMHENLLAPIVVPFVALLVACELAAYVATGRFGFWSQGVKTKSAVRIAGIAMCAALFFVWMARLLGALAPLGS